MISKQKNSSRRKAVLITGCSSGIGLHVAKRLHESGYHVIASARKPKDVEMLSELGLESIHLDLNDSQNIQLAVEQTLALTNGQLYALFNNGAYGQPGAVEDLSRELNAAADSDAEERELQVLAAKLVEQARTLSRSHARFTRNFRRDLADRAVASDQLLAAIDTYDRRYRTDLISMLELQDQLHQSLEPEEWREVAASLNQTAVRLDNRIMVSD